MKISPIEAASTRLFGAPPADLKFPGKPGNIDADVLRVPGLPMALAIGYPPSVPCPLRAPFFVYSKNKGIYSTYNTILLDFSFNISRARFREDTCISPIFRNDSPI